MSWFAILMTKVRIFSLAYINLLFYTIIVMKGVFKSHLKFKNAAITHCYYSDYAQPSAYKISDNILKERP